MSESKLKRTFTFMKANFRLEVTFGTEKDVLYGVLDEFTKENLKIA